jgi:hypothetical protein
MKKKISIGIDPGKSGFITEISERGVISYPIPTIKGKQLDIRELYEVLHNSSLHDSFVVLEDVHAIFGSSAKATFSFGYVCGVIEGILVSLRIPYVKVQPKKWQKEMWEGIPLMKKPSSTGKTSVTDTKAMSFMAAKRLFPDYDLRATERSTKAHDGKIDSLLIAEYCRRNFSK